MEPNDKSSSNGDKLTHIDESNNNRILTSTHGEDELIYSNELTKLKSDFETLGEEGLDNKVTIEIHTEANQPFLYDVEESPPIYLLIPLALQVSFFGGKSEIARIKKDI